MLHNTSTSGRLFLISCFFYSATAIAQINTTTTGTTTKSTVKTMSGAEATKIFGSVTDNTVYDREGNMINPDTVVARVRSYQYGMGLAVPTGQTEYKHVLMRISPASQKRSYELTKTIPGHLSSAKLQDGLILDLAPLAKRIDTTKLKGKAVLMIFWCDECYNGSVADAYKEINDITTTYANPAKLEILAITHHPYDVAIPALKKNPIINAHNIFEASPITSDYQTENRPVIVLTNKDHKIIFSVANHAGVTPWMLNKLLKENGL